MLSNYNTDQFFEHFRNCTTVVGKTFKFIKRNKLWNGFFDNQWVLLVTIGISLLFSYFLHLDILHFFESVGSWLDNFHIGGGDTYKDIKAENRHGMFSGGTRLLVLVFLEVVIFHFCVKAVNILTDRDYQPNLKDFIRAEKRMMIIMFLSVIFSAIVYFLVNMFTHMVGAGWATNVIMVFVYGYFMGFGFFDNYNEHFGLPMNDSAYIIRQHVGAATALGVVVNLMLYVPLVGLLVGPIFGGIAAALYGHKYRIDLTVVPESKKQEKKRMKKEKKAEKKREKEKLKLPS